LSRTLFTVVIERLNRQVVKPKAAAAKKAAAPKKTSAKKAAPKKSTKKASYSFIKKYNKEKLCLTSCLINLSIRLLISPKRLLRPSPPRALPRSPPPKRFQASSYIYRLSFIITQAKTAAKSAKATKKA
jgi:hypothetical protein